MKVIIQIPCFNEEQTLPAVLAELPKSLPGVDIVESLVIDDGSTDRTADVAKNLGVNHIVKICGPNRRWLGRAFKRGIDFALAQGADIVVNTDGDNQYPGSAIASLIAPIVNGSADIVIGDRNPGTLVEFSPLKRFFQRLGNRVVATVTGAATQDAVSGFRAYSREALLNLQIVTDYTYTLDSLVQAEKKGLAIAWIPITVHRKTRESRLIKNIGEKLFYSAGTIVRIGTLYNPEKICFALSMLFAVPGITLLIRFFYFYFFLPDQSRGHVQSVVIGGVAIVLAALLLVLSVIANLLSVNRKLIDELLTRIRRLECEEKSRAKQ